MRFLKVKKSQNLTGTISMPASKTHSFRALVLGALADGNSIIREPKLSPDWDEGVYGFRKNKSHKKVQLFKDFLQENNIFIISIDQKVAEKYLDIKIDLEIKRIPLDEFDLLIAATALANNLSLSTRNVKHFKRINF